MNQRLEFPFAKNRSHAMNRLAGPPEPPRPPGAGREGREERLLGKTMRLARRSDDREL
jgi:hypothetical protein